MVFKWVDDIVFHGNPPPKKPGLRQKYNMKKEARQRYDLNQVTQQQSTKKTMQHKPSLFERFKMSVGL